MGKAPSYWNNQVEQLTWWQRGPITNESIAGNNAYNIKQVKVLTKQRTPKTNAGLRTFLSIHRYYSSFQNGEPLTFSYLIIPKATIFYSAAEEDDNHFVSMSLKKINDRVELDYMDSNGELMSDKDRQMIKEVFSDIPLDIFYRNSDGKRIPESEAVRLRVKLLRTQFDDDSCGMYSTEYTRMMLAAKGDEAKIQQGIHEIRNLDVDAMRTMHAYQLGQKGIHQPKTVFQPQTQQKKAPIAHTPIKPSNRVVSLADYNKVRSFQAKIANERAQAARQSVSI
ncbi:MAG: hypothetical protein MK137_03805 [Rickettsiales bacterium]|nr:hypothetical protein [Rickettsiales bacterium]